ncbi:phytoene/squalene synthase family protein [Roseibacterium sp. SDUM158017]|uniref:15-cis-phytoene synthase n=1 Tax=Roseicyclus salinarum TaxID=3036773 RepID=UPI0024157002|nr:phytoene/squalene synthase family protein [Roseibacterium sp. SDUM158017]MDG4646907.1 phytoene/squalene synthase family protein [Roseibacterium sp. SDUM158017]
MMDTRDLEHCRDAIREGSYSFHAASRLLPARVRDPALALYAFCRVADDEVDLGMNKPAAVLALRDRLDLAYAGRPRNAPADRAMAALIEHYEMPRALPEALLEGLAWDGMERRYATLSQLRDYSARVAAAVGVMMCVLMRVREAQTLARACDLGVAMQLTNIARDVGEDARAGRLYLPTEWMDEAGIDVDAFLADPHPTPAIRRIVKRLLAEADRLYYRSEAGIGRLPLAARPGIFAARHCYDAIGQQLKRNGHDSVTTRAFTTRTQKMGLLGWSIIRAGAATALPQSAVYYAKPLDEVAFLVDAAAHPDRSRTGWGESVLSVLSQLEARDREDESLAGAV